MTPREECDIIMGNMIADTMAIIRRGDEKAIKELWIGIGLDMDTLNAETVKVLRDSN